MELRVQPLSRLVANREEGPELKPAASVKVFRGVEARRLILTAAADESCAGRTARLIREAKARSGRS